jgi:hypothetical protein
MGDHPGDFLIGQRMGGKGIFLLTGHGRKEREKIRNSEGKLAPDFVARDILSAAKYILESTGKRCNDEKTDKQKP